MSVVTLLDYTPIARFDGTAWTIALIQEADAADGTFATIETVTLDPVDTDPKNPAARDFTTENGTLANGWYRIVWQDADTDQSVTPPVQNVADDGMSYWPSISMVGALIRARTVDSVGNELGSFDAATRPTGEQVSGLIRQIGATFLSKIGPTISPTLVGAARELIALRTAMMVELSFYPDQITGGRSQYPLLKELFDESLAALLIARRSLDNDGEPGFDEAGSGMPAYSFPPLVGQQFAPGAERPWGYPGWPYGIDDWTDRAGWPW